jgi:hypothetical protein
VGVHARAVDAEDRLGHERRVQAVQLGDRLERELEGDRVVGRAQAVGVLEVDLVLAGRDLVMGGLDAMPNASSALTMSWRTSCARSVEKSK